MTRKLLAILGVTAAAVLLSGCEYKKPGTTSGTMYCDSSFENIIRQEIAIYENIYPKSVIGCRYRTQDEVMEALMSGETKLAVAGRDLTASERSRLESNRDTKNVRSMQIAVDAMALIVNSDNPVDMLSTHEVERILSGELTNWRQIQPDAPDLPIHVVVDSPNSGVTHYMMDKMMNGKKLSTQTVVTADSIQGVFDIVKTKRGMIGVIGVSWLTTNLTEPVPVDSIVEQLNRDVITIDASDINRRVASSGVKTLRIMTENGAFRPLQEYIYSGDYPYTRPVFMITTAHPASTVGKFYSFVTGKDGQAIMIRTGVMPARYERPVYEIR